MRGEEDAMSLMESAIGDELLEAITEAGPTKAIPVTLPNDQDRQVVIALVDEVPEVLPPKPPWHLERVKQKGQHGPG